MPGSIVFIVLCGALLHASWNAVVKSAGDKFLNAVMIISISMAISVAALPFFTLPHADSWPFLALSAVLQATYVVLIAKAYGGGDMSVAYPLMRGTAPMIVALTARGSAILSARSTSILLVSLPERCSASMYRVSSR